MRKFILFALACSMFILPSCNKGSVDATVEYSSNISCSGKTYTDVPTDMTLTIDKAFDAAVNEFKKSFTFTGSGSTAQEAIENADKKMTESIAESEAKRADEFVTSFTASLKSLGLPDNATVVIKNVSLTVIREKSSAYPVETGVSVLVKSIRDIVYP